MPTIVKFDGAYGRIGYIEIQTDDSCCASCKEDNVPLLVGDGSQDEYEPARICLECIVAMFSDYARGTDNESDAAYIISVLENAN